MSHIWVKGPAPSRLPELVAPPAELAEDGRVGFLGGRLYNTAIAIMTLDVYYRHMPLYRQKAFGD